MATSLGNVMPASLFRRFDSRSPDPAEGFTVLLISVSEEGWPHLAMLSVGEVLAIGPRELRLALWPRSNSASNLARDRKAPLAMVDEQAGFALRCSVQCGPQPLQVADGELAAFQLRVEDVLKDAVPYAVLEHGITFRLVDSSSVLGRWRETLAALNNAAEMSGS